MNTKELQKTWEKLGEDDPLWAIISRADTKGGKWNVDEFFRTGEKEIADVIRYVDALPVQIVRRKALDFGCGAGRLTQPLAKYFNEVVGVDIAASMIALAKQHNVHDDRCTYIHNTTSDLKIFADNCFDFVYTNITLQHMPPSVSKQYINEFLRIMAPHGILLFQLPSTIIVSNVKTFVLRFIPRWAVRLWYRITAGEQPRIDMYGTRRAAMIAFLKQNGATILDVAPDRSAGEYWESYRYCVTKSSSNIEYPTL